MAPSLRLAVLAACAWQLAAALRATEEDYASAMLDISPPPKEELENSLRVAQDNLAAQSQASAEAYKTAVARVDEVTAAMYAGLKTRGQDPAETQRLFKAYEDAKAALDAAGDAEQQAKELHAMVVAHNALVQQFFEAVTGFMSAEESIKANRRVQEAGDLDAVKKMARDRWHKENRQEVAGAVSLIEVFKGLSTSLAGIESKEVDLAAGGPRAGVHAAVQSGFEQVRTWANRETGKVCEKYGKARDEKVKEIIADIKAQHNGKVRCGMLMRALAARFPEEIETVSVDAGATNAVESDR